jgi:hypothetical protein
MAELTYSRNQDDTQSLSWHPLLDNSLEERALAAVQEIVADLPSPSATEISEASLSGGLAGLAVLSAYLTLAGLDDGENAERFLEQAVQAVSSRRMNASLYAGFTGVAWAAAHVQNQLGEGDDPDPHQEIDEALASYLNRSPWRGDYDLISGLVGFGVYALERLPNPMAIELLKRVVDRLDETAERNAEGIAWFTSPELLVDWQRQLFPSGYYNLGLAHGVPGVIGLLAQICAADVASSKARALLDGAVPWLLAQKLANRADSSFPNWVAPGIKPEDCRLAWCYGDAGIAAVLLAAARSVGNSTWQQEAFEIARRATKRSPDTVGVADAGLCHGAVGLGHIFNRMYQATGELWLKQSAVSWFERTLEMRRPTGGIGGFSALDIDLVNHEQRWVDDPGLLSGAAGIALALLAAATSVKPEWDRLLLVSIPNGLETR